MCKIVDSSLCNFCNKADQDILHMIYDCDVVKKFWEEFQNEFIDRLPHAFNLKIDKELVLFGRKENTATDSVLDFVVLYAKFFLYKCKLQDINPTFVNFLFSLKKRFQMEKYLACINCKSIQFEEQWALYHPIFV